MVLLRTVTAANLAEAVGGGRGSARETAHKEFYVTPIFVYNLEAARKLLE